MFFWRRVAPQAPEEGLRPTATPGYSRNFRTLNLLVSEGKSFSGYERNPLFINLGGSGFAEVGGLLGADFADDARAVATCDWDRDGDLDLWVTNRTAPRLRLLRNNLAAGSRQITIRLVGNGSTTNRDAIGARLVLWPSSDPARRQMRTVRGGDGFLSQSSAWAHFGLGREPAGPLDLTVSWPGGGTESFPGLEAGQRYTITQGGRAVAEPLAGVAMTGPGHADGLEDPAHGGEEQGSGRGIWVADRVPLPELAYSDPAGAEHSTVEFLGRPVLVCLWATWCAPCLGELGEMAARASALREKGVSVLALNVDGLIGGGSDASGGGEPDEVLDRLGFQFSRGRASEESLTKLAILIEHLTGRRGAVSLPTTVLVDSGGSVAAIYTQGLRWEPLAGDLALLDAPSDAQLARLSARPGRWAADPRLRDPRGFLADYATLFATNGLPAESQRLYDLIKPSGEARSAPDCYNQAKAAAQQGQVDVAIELYREAIRLDPDYGQAIAGLGAILLARGSMDEAESLFTRALEIDPNHAVALINLAMIEQSRGRIDSAVERLRGVVARNPDLPEAHLNLGSLLASQRLYPEAISHLKRAVELNPRQSAARFNLASAYSATEQWAEAEAEYRRALELNPRIPHAHHALGNLLARQGNHAAAVASYRQAIALGGPTASACARLGQSLLALGERDPAVEAFRRALEIDPANSDALRGLKEAAERAGE